MNLFIKQKIFSWKDRFFVYNENGEVVYEVEGELFSWGAKIHIYNRYERELFYIKQKLMCFLPEYEIYRNETLYARVKKELSFITPKLNVSSNCGDFVMKGDFLSMDFSIECNNVLIGEIHKKWFTWGDTYCLTVVDNEDSAFFTAMVIAIDHCLHNESEC
ncbi:LURP-one-related family protein [Paludicola sp. MB14-C6]|uniref:LURP-one-related/scramblase family protein n=1 Tax=Paludihabitans sp. MB14-C6 TaxID=3070656 RepID=UPI0027DCDCB1|nr:LURP-one-related family protein [Paludicola sp. MB14-C6]WMJ22540.1 LURP-one-related family protein [Paludicola sp. MB14-C6]